MTDEVQAAPYDRVIQRYAAGRLCLQLFRAFAITNMIKRDGRWGRQENLSWESVQQESSPCGWNRDKPMTYLNELVKIGMGTKMGCRELIRAREGGSERDT